MNEKPQLSKTISIEKFNNWYWYKTELTTFCRDNGLKTNGRKLELKSRIEHFLKTGKVESKNTNKDGKTNKSIQKIPENINDVIPDNYTSSQLFREYFKTIIGKQFHFTAYMMKYINDHPGITFREYANEWLAENKRRKNKNYKPKIMKSCEYNQYIRDFFENNSKYSLTDAIKCWKKRKSLQGHNKYTKEDLQFLK